MVKMETEETDCSMKKQIINEETAAKAIENNIRRLEKEFEELKEEQTQITITSAKFAWFFKNNAIAGFSIQ